MDILIYALSGTIILWPAFVLPVIAGIILPIYFRDDPIHGLAEAFTLKPLIATPVWLYILLTLAPPGKTASPVTLIPGIGLTLVIVYAFRGLFRTETKTFLILLGADAIRWLYSFAYLRLATGTFNEPIVENPLYLIGLILPNAYATLAFVILWIRRSRREAISVMRNP